MFSEVAPGTAPLEPADSPQVSGLARAYPWNPPLSSLDEALALGAANRPDGILVVGPDRRPLSYREFFGRAASARARLARHGAGPGSNVLFLCRNSIDLLAAIFGTWLAGAVAVPASVQQRSEPLANLLGIAMPDLIIADERGREALASMSAAPPVAVLDVHHLGEIAPEARLDLPSRDPAGPAMVLFSSGTTGIPKGCVLSHEYLIWCGATFVEAGGLATGDRVYSCNQLCHINAWWALAGAVVGGHAFVFDVRFSASRFWSRAVSAGATVFDYVGAQIPILLKQGPAQPPGRVLRAGLGGGTSEAAISEFADRFGVQLLECYGLTECCLPIFHPQHAFRLGSIGRCSRWFDMRLVDTDGRDVIEGADGELWLRSKSPQTIFSGYLNRPDLTARAFTGPWFRTGDRCRADADGYLYFRGRSELVIRSRGENVSASEVEAVIVSHDDVENCVLLGVEAGYDDADLLLAAQSADARVLAPDALIAWCRERLASFMVPRYVVVTDLPMTASGRVARKQLDIRSLLDAATDFGRDQPKR